MTTNKTPPGEAGGVRVGPRRFILEPQDVVAAFVTLGKAPPEAPLFAGLPVYTGTTAGRLLDKGGKLKPELTLIFEVLSDARCSLALDVFTPGGEAFVGVRFLSAGPAAPYVMMARTAEGNWDLALLTGADQLMVLVEDLLGLTGVPSRDTDLRVRLTVPALTALLAFGDLMQEEELQRRLARRTGLPLAALRPIVVGDLLRMVELGLDSQDSRWGVTLAALLGEADFDACRSVAALEEGVRQLMALELVDEDSLPDAGAVGLARALGAPLTAAAVVVAASGKNTVWLDHLVVYRTTQGFLTGVWGEGEGGRVLTLAETSAATVLSMIQAAATGPVPEEAAAASGACGRCGSPAQTGARFCTQCGEQLAPA